MSTIRAAVIGVGNMGTAHAVCLSQGRVEGMTLAALCDVDEARRAELREMFPGVPCYASVEELLAMKTRQVKWSEICQQLGLPVTACLLDSEVK